jgi:DNA-directed RNA polymerase subunit RPC12/RpoP
VAGQMPPDPPLRGAAKLFMGALRRISPRRAEEAEQESREWLFICDECGAERSYRSMGGIRWKAASKGKKTYMKCPTCGQRRRHSVERRRGRYSAPPLRP